MGGKPWCEEELAFLKENYCKKGASFVAEALNRSKETIYCKAKKIKLVSDRRLSALRSSSTLLASNPNKKLKSMHAWKAKVCLRDNFTCCHCGLRDERIVIGHHILERANNPELKTDLSNGITLCPNCHALEHYARLKERTTVEIDKSLRKKIRNLLKYNTHLEEIAFKLKLDLKAVNNYIKNLKKYDRSGGIYE